uniref:Uncharacterized protein n=1 Tax=Micrurus corallinus TaxID=54390 RepID=A0A2D4ELX6_MICCO
MSPKPCTFFSPLLLNPSLKGDQHRWAAAEDFGTSGYQKLPEHMPMPPLATWPGLSIQGVYMHTCRDIPAAKRFHQPTCYFSPLGTHRGGGSLMAALLHDMTPVENPPFLLLPLDLYSGP